MEAAKYNSFGQISHLLRRRGVPPKYLGDVMAANQSARQRIQVIVRECNPA